MYEKEFKYIMDYAQGKVDDIEIILSEDNSFSTRIHTQQIESFKYLDSKGIGIRIIKDGKVGYAYTEKFDEESFRLIVDEAHENSKFIENDEVVILENYPDNKVELDLYSKDLDNVKVEDKIAFTKKMEKLCGDVDERIVNVPYAVMGDGRSYFKITNSKGLNKEEITNNAYAYLGCIAADKDDKRMAFEFKVGRDFTKFDPNILAEKSARKSIDLLNGKEIKTGNYPIVFNSKMMSTILSTFSSIFSAKAVQEGKSLLKERLGEKIADAGITIIDDALHPDGTGTRSFDSEGYPAQKTVLVEDGVLKSFLHNTITARKDKTKSTGNATRNYKSSLVITPTNFYLKPGNTKREQLFKKYPEIVEIVSLQGMHSGASSVSGDFSLSGEGFLYANGKRRHSLKQFTISGNILDMLNNTEAIADDFEFDISSYGSSSVLIKELAISCS